MKVWIASVGHFVPEKVVSNQDIVDLNQLRIKASWVEKTIGIRERRWADSSDAASDLAVKACLATPTFDSKKFSGAIWVSTISQDYLTPSTSSIIKGKLGIKGNDPTYDMSAACAGQLFALEAAAQRLLQTQEKEALVIATEIRSRYLNKKDRRTAFLFGDGAAVFHIKKEENPPGKIEWISSSTLPTQGSEILVPAGGSVTPLSQEVLDQSLQFIKMNDGEKISELTSGTLVDAIQAQLKINERKPSDYDFFIFHQGNGKIAETVCGLLGVSAAKSWMTFDHFGNTASASLGITLSEAVSLGKLKKGQRVLLFAMGAGYHFSIASLVWGGKS